MPFTATQKAELMRQFQLELEQLTPDVLFYLECLVGDLLLGAQEEVMECVRAGRRRRVRDAWRRVKKLVQMGVAVEEACRLEDEADDIDPVNAPIPSAVPVA